MKSKPEPVSPDDVFARTAEGSAAVFDEKRALSAGFREMLKAIDGKRSVKQLEEVFPKLDSEDIELWLGELRRMKYVEATAIPFDLPEIKIAKPVKAAPRPASKAATQAAGGTDLSGPEFDLAEMAANIEHWVKQNTETLGKMRKADLSKTVQMAALQSTQAMENLVDSGFFASLPESMQVAIQATPPKKVAAPVLPVKKRLALVFETDPADTAVLTRLLNGAGYQAQLCNSRQQLVMLLNQATAPDVILLKLGARDVDAFKVLEKLRQHPRLGKVAVVMMADKPSREDIAKSILVGASGWMVKPYTEQVVSAAIQGVLTFPPVA